MRRITPKKYAQALYEATQDLDKSQINIEVENFIKLLAKNKDLKLADRIIAQLEKYTKEQEGVLGVEVSSAEELSGIVKKELKDKFKKEYQVEKVELLERQNKELIGGLVVRVGDKVLDGSLRTKLNFLKQKIS